MHPLNLKKLKKIFLEPEKSPETQKTAYSDWGVSGIKHLDMYKGKCQSATGILYCLNFECPHLRL